MLTLSSKPTEKQGGRSQLSHQFKQTKKYFKGLRRAQGDNGGATSTENSRDMATEGQKELLFARKRRVNSSFVGSDSCS